MPYHTKTGLSARETPAPNYQRSLEETMAFVSFRRFDPKRTERKK
jgi:hypothetical protein